jgi:nucleoside-diphosphate-sugar epimerase
MVAATAVSPASGPVAVTGASGFIGSWIVEDCVRQGYTVRACVRDRSNEKKVAHLLALNNLGHRGCVELYEADLNDPGSYDAAFAGAAGVIHAGAAVGFNRETPQQVYDGCFTECKHLIESVKKSGSVRRCVFTSSCAAVLHPQPRGDGRPPSWQPGYVFTERDWCTDHAADKVPENIPKNRDIAYSMAKAETEGLIYAEGEASDGAFECMSILPMHVIGPVMAKNHDQTMSWQWCVRKMMEGLDHPMGDNGRMFWNIVDVRDTARAHRLCLETAGVSNGSRYILAASDRSYEMPTFQLSQMLQRLFPHLAGTMGGVSVVFSHDLSCSCCFASRPGLMAI